MAGALAAEEARGTGSAGRRRFVVAVAVGALVAAIPVAWVLFDLFTGGISLTRSVRPSKFYTLQAQAMLHGHLWVQKGSLGIEGFVIGGRTYTYFGLFPSVLRLPFVAVFGRKHIDSYTAGSMAAAWALVGVLASMLLWRVRTMVRGSAAVSRLEAACSGALIATVLGGSTLVFLMAQPWVFSEDIVWSVALATGGAFFLVGLLERATWGRVVGLGAFVVAAEQTRVTTGVSLVVGAIGVGAYLFFAGSRREDRAKAVAVAMAGVAAALLAALVNELKFGILFGLPMGDHVWTQLNAHRRAFLAAHDGQETGLNFLPSNLLAYLQPFGLRLNGTFPFAWLPAQPAARVGGILFDQTYPTASIPASMPLLFGLSLVGLVTTLRTRGARGLALLRIPMLALGVSCAAIFFWGYIATRYLGDFIPLLILASSAGLVWLVDRLEGSTRGARRAMVAIVGLGTAASLAINVAIALSPTQDWSSAQATRFVEAQRSLSITPLDSTVHVVDRLPSYAPIGSLWAARDCSGLYLSNGTDLSTVPGKALQHAGMQPVERSSAILHDLEITFDRPLSAMPRDTTLLSWGRSKVVLHVADAWGFYLVLEHPDRPDVAWPVPRGGWTLATPGTTYAMTIATDPNLDSLSVLWKGQDPEAEGQVMLDHVLLGEGPAVVRTTGPGAPLRVVERPAGSDMALCRSLVGQRGRP